MSTITTSQLPPRGMRVQIIYKDEEFDLATGSYQNSPTLNIRDYAEVTVWCNISGSGTSGSFSIGGSIDGTNFFDLDIDVNGIWVPVTNMSGSGINIGIAVLPYIETSVQNTGNVPLLGWIYVVGRPAGDI